MYFITFKSFIISLNYLPRFGFNRYTPETWLYLIFDWSLNLGFISVYKKSNINKFGGKHVES